METAAPASAVIAIDASPRRPGPVRDRDRHGRGGERGGGTVAGERTGGPQQDPAARSQAGGEQRPPAIHRLHADRVHRQRDDDAGEHREQPGRVQMGETDAVGHVHQREEERALGREDVPERREALAHRDRGEAVAAVVVAELGRREQRRHPHQERAEREQHHIRPPAPR